MIWARFKHKTAKELHNWIPTKDEFSIIMLSCGLLAFNFFYFTTQMHERYLYPALIFFAIFALLNRKYFIYVLLS